MARMTAYSYRTVRTPLHRVGAGKKLAGLFILSVAAFFLGPAGLIASALTVAASAIAARMGPRELLAGSRPLAIATVLVAAAGAVSMEFAGGFRVTIDPDGVRAGAVLFLGILISFSAGSILFAATTTGELRDALGRAEEAVFGALRSVLAALPSRGCKDAAERLRSPDLSLLLALALAFIPRVFAAWEAAEDAHRARCGAGGIAGVAAVLPLAAERLIESAAETARALEVRGYEGAGSRRRD